MAKNQKADVVKHTCIYCGRAKLLNKFYNTASRLYENNGNVTAICKECVAELYEQYYSKYDSDSIKDKSKVCAQAVQRVCMLLNLYYSDYVFDKAYATNSSNSLIANYIKLISLMQHRQKTYDDTLSEHKNNALYLSDDKSAEEDYEISKETIAMFGEGFEKSDYVFLEKEYKDWTSRHECSNKSQEEIFKTICMNRLKAYKANIEGKDTKDLDKTFRELLDTGKLQPKQNKNSVSTETLSFGTLINQWENTRPIPKVDEELQDVDKIGLFIDVFFKGHLAKMMGLKNGLSKYYDEYMQQFAITRPTKSQKDNNPDEQEDSEAIFDALFGKTVNNVGDDVT